MRGFLLVGLAGAFCSPQPSHTHASTVVGTSRPRSVVGFFKQRQLQRPPPASAIAKIRMAASAKQAPEPSRGPVAAFFLRHRTFLLLLALILQKCVTDVLTNYTRKQTTYSATSASLLSEVAKFPLLLVAVMVFGGGRKRVVPTVKDACTEQPFSLLGVSLCYSVQNILYFLALSHLSAESYQVLSQSKLLFTAMLMVGLLGTRLRALQWTALSMLISGSLLVQLSEASRSVVTGGNAYLGGLWAILGSLLSALPNVYYEKLLKAEGTDEWVRNLQMTFWIFLWILVSMVFEGKGLMVDLAGFTPTVWLIIALKAFNCLLIPATLKYADNIMYSYAKPTSIVLTCAISSAVAGVLPAPRFVMGMVLVLGSIALYNKKPAEKAKGA